MCPADVASGQRVVARRHGRRIAFGIVAAGVGRELEGQGVVIRAKGRKTLGEEASLAYKDVEEVVNVVHTAGIALKVARLRPIAVIKG